MFEVKIMLDVTARLESAVYRLAEALSGSQIIEAVAPAAPVVPAVPAPAPAPAAPAPAPAPAAPVVPIAQSAPTPAAPTVPVAQLATTQAPAPVPLAQTPAPTYTKEQVARAGAELIQRDAAKTPLLVNLLTQYGVKGIIDLPDEHLGAFATALRQLGANI